ncbi:hypothetical protein MP228_007205 [Amoeboaphelidium protococcarum]|nr:hypothetical protein MP228_007205 [Amoeboaphelidium protococcarum]
MPVVVQDSLKSYTWQEVAEHNTRKSAWVTVHGKVYDVTQWIDKHPAGSDVILLAAGRDASQVFDTYHMNAVKAEKTLNKFLIGSVSNNELPVFQRRSEFFNVMKTRINQYFKDTKQNPKFHWSMLARYAIVLATVALSYYCQFFANSIATSPLLSGVCAAILGFACAQVGLLPLHDASHCAMTNRQWVWRCLGALHDFINGASYLNWCYQHMLGHHPYTNIANADPDITTSDPDVRRIKPSQRWYSRYVNQQYFVPFLYGVLGMKVRLQDVNLLFIEKKNDSIRVNPPELWHSTVFIAGKAFFVLYRFVVPLLFSQVSVARVLINFVIADLVSSYWLALTFQANHVVDDVEWPLPNDQNEISMDWAEMQVVTAQDYAHKSFFWTNFAGSLNYQVIHHVFPNICQHYYPEITPIVMKTCQEYGIRYRVKDTYWEAIGGHLSHLKKMGDGQGVGASESISSGKEE